MHRCYIDSNKVELTVETPSLYLCVESDSWRNPNKQVHQDKISLKLMEA